MKIADQIDLLQDQALSLEKAIDGIDYEIGYWLPHMDTAADPERTVSFLKERYEIRGSHMFAMGKVMAQIDELERRMQEGQEYVPMERVPAEERLGGLDDRATDNDFEVLERRENRLAWLELDEERPQVPSEEGQWQEPERDRSLER